MWRVFKYMDRFSAVGKYLLIASTVLLLVSLFVVFTTGGLPNEIEQEISLLNYEHQGRFDYLAHQKASYLFGDIPLEPAPEAPESPNPLKTYYQAQNTLPKLLIILI